MKKPLKIVAILVGVVVVLLAIVIIFATIFIDPNRYRDEIVQAVKTQTGRDLRIEGDLKLSFFPWLGLETGSLQLSNAPGFGPEPFARVDGTLVKVELLPLLRREVRVDAVRLNGLKLHLAKMKDGRTNWDDLTKAQAEEAKAPAPAKPTGDARAALGAFSINRFEVRSSELTYRDAATGAAYALRDIQLTSGNVLGESPAPFSLAFDLESGKPKVARRVQLDARLHADLAKQTLNMPDLRLSMGDLKVQAQLQASGILDAPKAKGRIEVPPFNLRALLQELGIAYAPADANALTKVGLAAQLDYGPQAMSISDLRVTLDDTALTGNFARQRQPRTVYRFSLAIDNLDVDRYMPPAETDKKEKDQAAKATVIPLALLRDNDADGQLRIGKLKAAGIRSEQVAIKVVAHNGRIALGPNEAKLYGGVYAGRTTLDASGAIPTLQFDEKLTGVQLGPFLKDADLFDRYTGTGNVDLKLTARGLDAEQIKRSLNGAVAVQLRDGKIEGVNLQKIVQQAQALLKQARGREVDGTAAAGDETAFKSLTATARLTNGVARNDDLKLEGPVVRAQGAGTANLVEESLDYRLQVTLAEGEGRTGTTVPVRISGPFADPKYRVDLSSLFKQQAKPLEEKLEKQKDEARDKLRDRLLERLKR